MSTWSPRAALLRQAGCLIPRAAPAGALRRLLVIKPDHFGDVLLAGPALHALRRGFADADITLAVGQRGLEVARRLPGVDHLVVVPFPGLDPAHQPSLAVRWLNLVRWARLWHGRFDAGFLLRDDFYWGAILLAAARIPLRAGTATPRCAPFLTHAIAPSCRPAAAHHLHVVAQLTGADPGPDAWTPERPLRFQPGDAGAEALSYRVAAGLAPDEPYILLHPGAGAPIKLWTPERWAAVLRTLQRRLGMRTLVLAGGDERDLLPPILRHAGSAAVRLDRAPDLDLLAALMAGARLVLGVDSGPLHLAAALDVPSVRLYGPVDPRVYGPWGDPRRHRWVASQLLCAPCGRLHWDRLSLPWHPCVRRLEPEAVVAAALAAVE